MTLREKFRHWFANELQVLVLLGFKGYLASKWAKLMGQKFGLVVGALLVLLPVMAIAAPPYDVTITFTAPAVNSTQGAPTGYRLYRGCRTGETKTLVGAAANGQKFTGLLTTGGEHSFCLHALNATGEGPRSNIAIANINDFDPVPGAPTNFTVTVTCDASCTVNITSSP